MKPTAYYERRIIELETEVERLTQVAEADRGKRAPLDWGLTPAENAIVCRLAFRELASVESLRMAAGSKSNDTVRVQLHNAKRKLEPHGYTIRNRRGHGYTVSDRLELKREICGA